MPRSLEVGVVPLPWPGDRPATILQEWPGRGKYPGPVPLRTAVLESLVDAELESGVVGGVGEGPVPFGKLGEASVAGVVALHDRQVKRVGFWSHNRKS